MRSTKASAVVALVCLLLAACAPAAAPAGDRPSPPPQRQSASPARTLVIASRGEPPSLAAKPLQSVGGALDTFVPLYNAVLDYMDANAQPQPYLAEALPQLNAESWRVFPDGRMETTYRLRPNLAWHDGTALSAEDFVFGYTVYATPELGAAASPPIAQMAEVIAPDARTVVIRWRELYADAGVLQRGFQPLPRHILEGPYRQMDAATFSSHPFWAQEYVGLGPYRVERWEPGSAIEAVAFDQHALGRPKIDRVRVVFIADANATLASMLTGDVHYSADFALFYEEGTVLEREWAARGGGGVVLYSPTLPRITQIQFRPELVSPRELLDVRVRRAIAHAIDTPQLIEVMAGTRGLATPSITSPLADYHPQVDRAVAKYPYDQRRARELLEGAGLQRRADGMYSMSSEIEVWHITGAANERENAIIVESLRRAGIDATSHAYPSAQLRDTERRAKLPAFFTGGGSGGEANLMDYGSAVIPKPENRWQGGNRGAWSSAEFDRAWELVQVSLDRNQRIEQIVQMERILSEDVGAIMHYYSPTVNAHAGNLRGPTAKTTPEAGVGIRDVHTWEWTS